VIGVLLRERLRIQVGLAIVQVSKLNPAIVRVIKVNPCHCGGALNQLCWNIEPVLLEKLSQLCWNIEPVLLEKLSQLCWNIEPGLVENIDYLPTAGYINSLTLNKPIIQHLVGYNFEYTIQFYSHNI